MDVEINKMRVWTVLIWFRAMKSGGLYLTLQLTFGFHKIRKIYGLA